MAVKTITIDMDAYDRLSRLKKEGQSFSQVIKELTPPVGSTAGDFIKALDAVEISESTLDAVDRAIEDRTTSPVRVPTW
ncbi:MAG: antitoxin VapB family protein [Trueperaceae bacterium]